MKQECVIHLTQGKVDAELIIVFRCSIESQEKQFVNPIDDTEVHGGNYVHYWKT